MSLVRDQMTMLRAGWLAVVMVASTLMFAPVDAADAAVEVGSNYFDPDSVTIPVGGSVEWNFVQGVHDVTAGTPSEPGEEWCERSGSGGTCERVFDAAGLFEYFCTIHDTSMFGEVIVVGDLPTIDITSPLDGETIDDVTTITGTATGDPGIDLVDVRIDGGDWQPATGDSSWTFELDTNLLANGVHTIDARVTAVDTQWAITTIEVMTNNAEIVDFDVTSFTATTDVFGQPRLTVSIANHGTYLAAPRTVFEYLYDDEWHFIDAFTMEIAPGDSITQNYRWTSLGYVGDFRVRAVVDPDDLIEETNEGNNEGQATAGFFIGGVPGMSARD